MNIMFNPPEPAGLLNAMLFSEDPRPANEQFEERYAHGGGWSPFGSWEMDETPQGKKTLIYSSTSEDETPEAYPEAARATLRDETIIMFEGAWVAIIQPNGDFEVARMD